MDIKPENKIDLLDINKPSLSSTSDMPVIETKPDAQNEGKPPAVKESKDEVTAAESKTPESKTPGESATPPAESTAADDEKPEKRAKGVQKRLDELTKREADALRQVEAERQEKLRLLALLEARGKPEEKPAETKVDEGDPVRPNKADFTDPDAYDAAMDTYIDARSEWRANKAIAAAREDDRKTAEQRQIEEGQKATREAYSARVEKAKGKYTDYSEVAESPEVQVSIPMAHAILHSEHGPDIAYHLGKNPADAERIAKLAPPLQLVELGLIVAKLSAPVSDTPASKPPLTQAPKPIKPLGAGSESSSKDPENESMDEYAARRKKELASEARPGMRH